MLLAQVVEAWPYLAAGSLGPKLGEDEGVQQPAEQVAVAQHGARIEAQDGCHDGGRLENANGELPIDPIPGLDT